MDWARAKSIFIVVLLCLNIFLGYFVFTYFTGSGIPKETLANTESILASRGVTLDCDLPAYNRKTPSLIYGNGAFDGKLLAEGLLDLGSASIMEGGIRDGTVWKNGSRSLTFANSYTFTYTDSAPGEKVRLSDQGAVERTIKTFLEGAGLKISEYIFDNMIRNENGTLTLQYIRKYKGFPVFDSTLDCTVGPAGITQLQCRYRDILGFSSEKRSVVAAYQILLKDSVNYGNAVITQIDLGYRGNGEQDAHTKQSTERPVWRVKIKGRNAPVFYDSDTGEILQ